MLTRFKVFAVVAALAVGTSSAAMAEYPCAPGYALYGGVCQPVSAPGYSNPASGTVSGEATGAASGYATGGPIGAVVGGALAPPAPRLPAPSICWARRVAPTGITTTTATAISAKNVIGRVQRSETCCSDAPVLHSIQLAHESVGDLTDHPRPQFVINGPD
jgi:hypothetical protein